MKISLSAIALVILILVSAQGGLIGRLTPLFLEFYWNLPVFTYISS